MRNCSNQSIATQQVTVWLCKRWSKGLGGLEPFALIFEQHVMVSTGFEVFWRD